VKSKIPVDDLRDLIVLQFGSQADLAKKIGSDEPRVSRGIKNQSPKFMAKLIRAGLKVDTLLRDPKKDTNISLQEKIKKLNEKIIVLENMCKQKDNLIEHQNKLIDKYSGLLDKQSAAKK